MSCWSSAFFRGSRVALLMGLVAMAGCSSAEAPSSKESAESYETDLRLATPRYLGQIASGETKTNVYSDPPPYRAFGFTARGGQEITVDVAASGGDAMAWITTATFNVLASNDDASQSTLDSKVVYKIPAGTASRAYRVAFREFNLEDTTFTVKLSISGGPNTCTYDSESYQPGDHFGATDGCNTCSCSSSGHVSCTANTCACDPEAEPWRNYVGTARECATLRYSCTPGKRPFQNDCGCGCELLSH